MATITNSTITDWNINTDIYDILENIDNLKRRYIENEDDTSLSMGIFGFISDTEAKKIQIATIMAGQLGNEMFPTRANLTKNVLTHSVYHGIEGINAVPAVIEVMLCIKYADFEQYLDDDNHFYLEADAPIFIGDYEFHFDYDVRITRTPTSSNNYSYSAQYVITDDEDNPIINRLSKITHPYLRQPFFVNIGNDKYLGLQCLLRQCTIETIDDTMTSDSVIENRSYEFQFDNQLADFNITIYENDKIYQIRPYLYGTNPDETNYYCWYNYIADDTIRVTFDNKSFQPGLNSQITIRLWTTLGYDGNFEYLNIDRSADPIYVDIQSIAQPYNMITCYMDPLSDSQNGSNRKSKEELQKLIPKAALSRGTVTTEADLQNYFNLINTDINRMVMQKKVDNQLARIWYGYLLLKDDYNNIIPSNTLTLKLDLDSEKVVITDDGRYVLPAGSTLSYDPSIGVAEIIDDSTVPALNTRAYFDSGLYYYTTIYNTVLCKDPLYSAFYLTNRNYNSYFQYEYVNDDSAIQFIASRFHFERQMLTDQDIYKINFIIVQSVIDSENIMYSVNTVTYVDEDGNPQTETITTQNIRIVMVLYKDNNPYRWTELDLQNVDANNAYYTFGKEMVTDTQFDDQNNIRILGLNEAGSTKAIYGYFGEYTDMKIYILAKTSDEDDPSTDYARKDLDAIAPGYSEYTITNVYTATEGISFYNNYTNIMNTKVEVSETSDDIFNIYGIPVIGRHYLTDETNVKYLLEAIDERKSYIDYCLQIVENTMNIDFKFFNTYGDSKTYTLGDKTTLIGSIDTELRFKISLKDESDITTKDSIVADIKDMIEDLNEIADWHISKLIQDIMNKYDDRINFIEFVGFNEFDADDQHIILIDPEDPTIVPEFICVRNILDEDTNTLVPSIQIETV